MGRDLAELFPIAAQTFAEADEALGFPISKLIFEGPEEDLKLTENTQPAILTVSVARMACAGGTRRASGPGRWTFAGRVVGPRCRWNPQLCRCGSRRKSPRPCHATGSSCRSGSMAAVLALPAEQVAEACSEAAEETGLVVSAANLNSPTQTVISGALALSKKPLPSQKQRALGVS